MKPERTGDFYAIACALVCGLGNIPAKAALENLTPEIFNLFFFIAGFLISSLSVFKRSSRQEIFSTSRKAFGLILILAFIFTFGLYTFIIALKLIEPATISFLSRFEVILTVILAYIILRERLRPIELLGGLIALGGIFILKFKTNIIISHAATLMILSSFFFAAAEIIVKKYINLIGTMRFLFWRNLFMIFIFLAILLIRGQALHLPTTRELLLIISAALLLPVLGRATYIEALKRIKISRATLLTQSTPLFTAAFAWIILSSLPAPIEWLGGSLILAGVVVVRMTRFKINFNNRRPKPV